MKRESNSVQDLIVASEATDTKSDQCPGLINNGFLQEVTLVNAPTAGHENGAETLISPVFGRGKRIGSSSEKLYTNDGETKTESDNSSRILFPPKSTRLSQHSTDFPFAAFEMPETTAIPTDSVANSTHKRKSNIRIQEVIPIMPLPVAVVCLVFNVVLPGSGTVLSGFIAFFLSRKELSAYDRTMILCTNCIVGLVQLATVVFLFIGWFWSVTWGCAFVGLSSQYSKVADENTHGGIA